MMDRIRNRTGISHDEGFTLIELLIVIVLLGILAAIVIFAVGGSKSDAETAACSANVSTVRTAAEAYKAKNGTYPTALSTSGFLGSTAGMLGTYDATTGTYTCPAGGA